MSYYSDVGLVISKDDYDRMCEAISDDGFNLIQCAEVVEFARRADSSSWVYLKWTDERWYIGHDGDVDEIEAFLETIPHEYLRSGEEVDDIEHRNSTDYGDVLGVIKQVTFYP